MASKGLALPNMSPVPQATTWPGRPILRHNDAGHPIYALQSLLNVAPAFAGTGEDAWSWALCDAPTLLCALLVLGLGAEPGVQAAVAHLVTAVDENGWRCRCGPELGRFRGPGRKADPCPSPTSTR